MPFRFNPPSGSFPSLRFHAPGRFPLVVAIVVLVPNRESDIRVPYIGLRFMRIIQRLHQITVTHTAAADADSAVFVDSFACRITMRTRDPQRLASSHHPLD